MRPTKWQNRFAALAFALGGLGLGACQTNLDESDLEEARSPRVDAYFNAPGSNEINGYENSADDVLVQMIYQAEATIDFSVMGFSNPQIVEALVAAHHRGVRLRFVGDARHAWGNVYGYAEMDALNIPIQHGNQNSIMHNKFFIIDDHTVFVGTGNITPTGFGRNDNNWVAIDSPAVAAEFQAEFDQLFAGRFGYAKEAIENGNTYQVDDARVQVYFSPQEDTMGRLLQAMENADENIEFFIFAFTKDQVGSLLITKHLEFERFNACCDPSRNGGLSADEVQACTDEFGACPAEFRERYVRGVIDRSQLHSNGPYHEVYRLMSYGLDIRMDGNDNSRQPGDYQAGGGRQHSKSMIIDWNREDGEVVSGSFNWSSSATISNDETLLVINAPRLAEEYHAYFDSLYERGKPMGENWIGDGRVEAGDVVFNEIHWDGYNGDIDTSDFAGDEVYNDEFIELLNTTDRTIDLSLWQIATDDDFAVGLYPGTVIGPYERLLILDHNTLPYNDLIPQEQGGAFRNPDFVMNMANDQRFLRMNLHNLDFRLRLMDPRGQVSDIAGDGGPPFAGGRIDDGGTIRNYSMERIHVVCPDGDADCSPIGPGDEASSWQACQREQGGENVRPAYRDIVIATPGRPNSGGEQFPDEDPLFRAPPAPSE